MNRTCRALAIALCLALALAATAHAVGEGRIIGTVLNPEGKPIPGIKISLTRPGTSFKMDKVTDNNGKFTLLILDATQEYVLRMEKAGYDAYEETVKPKPGDVLRLSYTLAEIAPQPATGPSEEEVKKIEGQNAAVAAFNEGVTTLQANNLAVAATKFEEATKLDPTLAPAFGALAEVQYEQKKYAEALAAADRYLELEPGAVRGLRVRFDAARAMNDKEKLGKALEALVAGDKSRETAVRIYNLGAETSRAGDRDGAIAYFKRAIEIDPTLDQAYAAMGQVLLVKKSYKEAVQAVDPVLARNPKNLEALTIRYEALKAAGDKAGATAAQEAMKAAQASMNPDDLFKQGVALYNANNMVDAVEAFSMALTVNPKHAKSHYMLGLAYAGTDAAKAKEHLTKFLELAPNDPDAAQAKEMLTYLK
ncbi:MAG TPA: tetratricopeptide repeat protein [Thermoanaerobaculia bacterium]|jgi:tetratricopeptide (TPR) repeat protein|nr:tetratricopeptide repeat protein [Thermoanaerobaculia bacterium]